MADPVVRGRDRRRGIALTEIRRATGGTTAVGQLGCEVFVLGVQPAQLDDAWLPFNAAYRALFPLLEAEGGRVGENEKDGLVVNHYVNVPGSEFSQMGWHTDSLRDVFYGKRIGPMLNVGLHLDGTRATNGGLRVIPGTHRQSLHKMLFRKKYYKDVYYDPAELAIETEPGDLTVHDGRMWHRVAQSPLLGEASRRRVMYVPIIAGKYQPKTESSPTPFYLRFLHLVK